LDSPPAGTSRFILPIGNHRYPFTWFPAESLKTVARAAATAAGAALGGFLFLKIKGVRQSAAIIELANLLSQLESPDMLTRDAVSQIESKYDATLVSSSLEELKSIYGTFVEYAIPAGDSSLTGEEAPRIQSFKQALGLSDTDAAPVHIDVGRRVLRGRLEAGSRGEDIDARKTFQKLIYVSTLVFGERQAAFLLPWARVFGLTDAQIQVARRDNAKSLFKHRVMSNGGLSSDRESLVTLKSYQTEVRLADDEAASVIIEAAQATLQTYMDQAIECLKRRTRVRDLTDLLSAVRQAIDFNRNLAAVKGDAEVPQGVAAASLAGTSWEAAEGRQKDLREVFR